MIDFIKLYKKDSFSFYDKFKLFFSEFKESYDLKDILPDHYLKMFLNEEKELMEECLDLDKDYSYLNIFNNHTFVFDSLVQSKIDGLLLLAYKEIEKNETIISNLNSFNPKNSFSRRVNYNRVETTTGRLTVKSGPKILTIPSRCRNIIKSRFNKGHIVHIDFKSLEPRIMSYITGNDFCEDIYEEIHSNLSFKTDRSVIKRAVISLTYGSSIKNIENMTVEKTKEISEIIEDYFNFNKLIDLSKKVDQYNLRRNYFGRPIHNLNEKNDRKILNNFIQSTAVDISLNYFYELIKKTDRDNSLPLFIIHDAIIFDVSSDYIDEFKKIVKQNYKNKLGIFPLDIT